MHNTDLRKKISDSVKQTMQSTEIRENVDKEVYIQKV